MPSTLLLIRHGPSSHSHGSGWIDAGGFQRWRDAYDAAGIDLRATPPAATVNAVATADAVVSSDLRRAKDTAERLARSKPIVHTPLLRETVLDLPAWIPMRLPVSAWDGLNHLQWGYGILLKADASQRDRQRAGDAITWLQTLGTASSSIAVVTHGVFRRLLAMRLLELGWQAQAEARSYRPWSVWSFARET